jgi:fucose permease
VLRPERGTALVFAVSGAIQASWMSRLPAIQDRLRLGPDDLGVALSALGVGTLAGMLVTGRLTARAGSRRVIRGAAVGAAMTLVAIGFAPAVWVFVTVSLAFGATVGIWDAGMNIQGAAVAQENGAHLMARFHGLWSIGTVVGAASGAAAARGGVPVGAQCVLIAAVSLSTVVLATRAPVGVTPREEHKPVRITRRLVMLGSLILAGGFVEGAANDWLAVFLSDERGFSHFGAAVAYSIFVAAMTAGRLGGERLHRRMSPDLLVGVGALVAAAGVTITVLAPVEAVVYMGAAAWGLGICFVFPVVLAAGGSERGADQVVGTLTTVGYGAGFIGPLLLGAIAGRVQLGTSLLLLPMLALAVAWLAPSVRPAPDGQPGP